MEGCALHIARAWNRRRTHIGLTRYTRVECDARVAEWWDTVKGVFLSTPLLPHVRALRGPPVPSGHGAFEKCKKFLEYLNTTWMQGPFKNMWCKWKVEDCGPRIWQRPHRRLGDLIDTDHPPLSVLIEALRKLDYEARAVLQRLQEVPDNARVLSRHDSERGMKIAEEMRRFETYYCSGPNKDQIEEYCKKMSRYVTNKPM